MIQNRSMRFERSFKAYEQWFKVLERIFKGHGTIIHADICNFLCMCNELLSTITETFSNHKNPSHRFFRCEGFL